MLRLQLLGGVQLSATDGRDLRPLLGRPKRLALLAYLAAREGGGFVRRDTLTALLWPEMDQAAARKAVRQALYVLRNDLGEDLFDTAGDDEVRVLPEACWCDVPAFLDAVRTGRQEEALELYRGDLMPAFFVPDGGAGFERWLEEERGRLRTLASKAAWDLAEGAERNRKSGPASTFGRQALSLTHDDETALRRLIALLDRMGDRAGALRAYETFARRLKEEFGDEPSAESRALIARIRTREVLRASGGHATTGEVVPLPPPPSPPPAESGSEAPAAAPPVRRAVRVLAALLVIACVGFGLVWHSRSSRQELLIGNTERVGTTDAAAKQHYLRGLELWYHQRKREEAAEEFSAAVTADTTFAMAAYMVSHVLSWYDQGKSARYLSLARRMARYASPREQQLIELAYATEHADPRSVPMAELLVTQYPRDPALLVKASLIQLTAGNWTRAVALARSAIAIDALPLDSAGPCVTCEAYSIIGSALLRLDSLPAAEREARAWRAARPDDVAAEGLMVAVFDLQGRYEESRAIQEQVGDRGRGSLTPGYASVGRALRLGDIAAAEVALSEARRGAPDSAQSYWDLLHVSVLRHAGRLTEALREARGLLGATPTDWDAVVPQLAFERGDLPAAVHAIRRRSDLPWPNPADSTELPNVPIWRLIRGSTYFAAAGDTVALLDAAVRLQQLGPLTSSLRHARGYHYPLGLLARIRGDTALAETEFRAAIFAPSDGYTRINAELAELLSHQGRSREAIQILRSALHTDPLGGPTLYVTQTELHEKMGQAFAALGEVDSARVHFDYVTRVWAHADPIFHARRASAQAYLDQLPGS